MKLPQGFTWSKSRDCFLGQLLIIAYYGRCAQQFHERNMNHDVTAKNVHNLLLIPFGVIATISAEIWLTLAFKEEFWKLSLQGYTGTAAFRKLGYNTEVIGFERIHNTTKRIRRDAQSIGGLHEGNSGGVYINRSRKSKTDSAESQAEEATKRMQKEIVCLQQQMAFLKKVMKLHEKQEK